MSFAGLYYPETLHRQGEVEQRSRQAGSLSHRDVFEPDPLALSQALACLFDPLHENTAAKLSRRAPRPRPEYRN